jgi:hypothetical protein
MGVRGNDSKQGSHQHRAHALITSGSSAAIPRSPRGPVLVRHQPARRIGLAAMLPVRALVKNGRLTLDEPTTLPEGQVVYLQPVDGLMILEHEDRDDDDRAALHAELEASLGEAEAGETVDFSAALAKLRQRL